MVYGKSMICCKFYITNWHIYSRTYCNFKRTYIFVKQYIHGIAA